MSNKVYSNAEEAIAGVADSMTIILGGFGLCGLPEKCILALRDSGVKNITCVSNYAGRDDLGLRLLLQTRSFK